VSYSGPPPTTPPPAGWRPPVVAEPAPPRRLPAQDLAALTVAERQARRVTWAVSGGASLIALLIVLVLLGRLMMS
jgi:hypothetical protein